MKIRNIIILLVILAVLGGVYYFVSRPEAEEPEITWYLYGVDESEIQRIEIELRDGSSQGYYKVEDVWYCEDGVPVDLDRWPGIQLLVSGPATYRLITQDATDEQLAEYGLLPEPAMIVTVAIPDGDEGETVLVIDVGDAAISGEGYYVKSPTSNAVGLVDYTWHDELYGLIEDPRCSSAEE